MKIGHVLGKWLCLWTYKAEPAPTGKASFGELSVSNIMMPIAKEAKKTVTNQEQDQEVQDQ